MKCFWGEIQYRSKFYGSTRDERYQLNFCLASGNRLSVICNVSKRANHCSLCKVNSKGFSFLPQKSITSF